MTSIKKRPRDRRPTEPTTRMLVMDTGNKFSERDFDQMQALLERFCESGFCLYQNKMGCTECPRNLSFDEIEEMMTPTVRIEYEK